MSTEILEVATASSETAALGVAASQLRLPFVGLQVGVTAALSEMMKDIPPQTMGEIALTAFAVSLVVGYLYEVETLKKSGFTVNEATSIAHLKVENPHLATLIGNVYGQLSYFINPVDMGATLTSLSSNDQNHLIYANLLSRTIIGFSYTILLNWAIQQGFTQELLKKLEQGRELVVGKLDAFFEATGLHSLDEALFPAPYFLDYPDNTSGNFRLKSPLQR